MTAVKNGTSFFFYCRAYPGTNTPLRVGDKVLIGNKHTAEIITKIVPSLAECLELKFEETNELYLQGTGANRDWEGKVIDQFEFGRLTFVGR